MTDRDLCLALRQAVLMALDAFERWLLARGWLNGPRTSELRHEVKKQV